MKTKILLLVVALVAAFLVTSIPAAAQSTNGFNVNLGTNVVIQPAVSASSVTVQSVSFNFVTKRADIFASVNGTVKHWAITGAAFTTFVTGFQAAYGTPLASYLVAHPPQ